MTPLPQVNCTLTAVQGGGTTHDYRRSSTAVDKWAGESGAFVNERLVSKFNSGGAEDRIQRITLYVDGDLPVDLKMGDTVVYVYEGNLYSARVGKMASPRMPGVPSYSTLDLEEIDAA